MKIIVTRFFVNEMRTGTRFFEMLLKTNIRVTKHADTNAQKITLAKH